MTRTVVAAVMSLLFAASTFAAQTHTYIVGVKPQRNRLAIAGHVFSRDADPVASRDFTDYRHIDAFSMNMTEEEAAAMARQPDVRFVEPSIPVHAFEVDAPRAPFKAAATDTAAQSVPWGISAVDATQTWVGARGKGVNVAIVDTGIDYNHPDLRDEYFGGYNAITKTSDPLDDNGHGTHVAGTIAAADNGFGVVGVAPNARIWSVKVLDSEGSGSTVNIAAGINWVIAKKQELGGNWIINMSLGICSDPTNDQCATTAPQSMLTACQKAADAGILIFAASGNDSTSTSPKPVGYPAAFTSVEAIGAIDSDSKIASFSNQGPELDFVGPGVGVYSTWLQGKNHASSVVVGGATITSVALQGSANGSYAGEYVDCLEGFATQFPTSVKGKFALIKRGGLKDPNDPNSGLTFAEKTRNALAAGAAGVIIWNKDASALSFTLVGNAVDAAEKWPVVVAVTNADGQKLVARTDKTVTLAVTPDDYATENGTSMATPHAAGVAALVWSAAPTATANDVLQALTTTAHDLGAPGQDSVYGFGLVDAYRAAKMLAPQLFGNGQTPVDGPTGRRILRRGRG